MTGLIAAGSVSAMEAGRLAGDAVDAMLRHSGIAVPGKS
jgi:hypothetical protein